MLGLHPPILMYVPLVKKNIIYSVKPKSTCSIEQLVCKLATSLMQFKHNFPKMIIFCRRYKECSEFYTMFSCYLRASFTYPVGVPSCLSKYRVVDMYTSCTQEKNYSIISFF